VTGLVVVARIGSATEELPTAWMAWPDGNDAAPVIWTREQAAVSAPYGVLTPELQAFGAESLSKPEQHLHPPLVAPIDDACLEWVGEDPSSPAAE
jgi:hypothetical protein